MNKIITLLASVFILVSVTYAQTTALQFSGADCNDNPVDLFADLDSGKAVVLHFYMPNCGSCPPPAKKIQTMAENVMKTYPNMVKGYAFPYQNSTACASVKTWVTSNNLSLYAPMDSGATAVAHYGGFGMPTVVLLGGSDHKVLFSTQSFATSDTTEMRDSIISLLSKNQGPNGIKEKTTSKKEAIIYPNPSNQSATIEYSGSESTMAKIQIINMLGEIVVPVFNGKSSNGVVKQEISTANLQDGLYFVRIKVGDKVSSCKFTVMH